MTAPNPGQCGNCARGLTGRASLYYCDEACQRMWHERQVGHRQLALGADPSGDLITPRPAAPTLHRWAIPGLWHRYNTPETP